MLSIDFYGATNTVTGSKFLLNNGTDQVLVECGMFQGLKELRLKNWDTLPFSPSNLRAVAITHAHIDHTGYLPKLVKDGFNGPVYTTGPTADLCGILLPDSGHLQEEEAFLANENGYSKHSPALPLYTAEEAEACLKLLVGLPYGSRRKITPDLWMRLLDAGHILGSSIVEVWLNDGNSQAKIVFSGDLGRYGDPILNDPAPVAKADYLVIESTYGDRQHPEKVPEEELVEEIEEIVRTQGILLIPAFSVGRTQRLLFEIHKLETSRKIPPLPIYVDSPMAIDATDIFLAHPEAHRLEFRLLENDHENHPLRCQRLRFVRQAAESAALDHTHGPAIIISASGMATGGRVLNHLKTFLPDPDNTVLFVGFQGEGTRGRDLLRGATQIKIHGDWIPVDARIRQIDGLSAHADADDLMRWMGTIRQAPKKVLLVHGEQEALRALAKRIEDRFGFATHVPSYGERFVLER